MKKIPQVDTGKSDVISVVAEQSLSESADDTPVIPGTEQPRSLGELMREAEQAVVTPADDSAAAVENVAQPNRRKPKKTSRAQSRRFARERALQALYQWDVSRAQSSTVRQEFIDNQDMGRVDVEYFSRLFNGVSQNPQVVDDALQTCLDRPIADLDPIERGVLRLAAFELTQQLDVPARVVINEGIEITKRFGADKGHRYVNGVLDKLAMSLRPLEMKQRH